jgi:hypothetical protein
VPLVLVALAIAFLIANRAAYQGYFQDDDLDTLGWTWTLPLRQYAIAFITPEHAPEGLRPAGHVFYRVMDAAAGLNFVPWIAALQTLHLFNGALVWLILRQFGLPAGPAVAGLIVFLFHPATFDAYWRPMFVFDVLCATFTLLAFLLYVRGRWLLSLPAFWLAYKAKELAVMLPVVLLLYELTLGDRRLRRLIPFAIVSASFTVQALIANRATASQYTLQFTWDALATTSRFYFYQMFRNFVAGALVLASPLALRDRRIGFAVTSAILFFGPLLLLPHRMLPVYTYLSLAFVALALALIAEHWRWARIAVPAAMLLLWAPVTWGKLRAYQARELEAGDMNRVWVASVAEFVRSSPQTRNFVIDGRPAVMQAWGAVGALRYLTRRGDFQLASLDSAEGRKLMEEDDVALLIWDGPNRTLHVAHKRK